MKYEDDIHHLIEYPEVYDGWSVAVLNDGTMINRWANEDGTGPILGYSWRYDAVQKILLGQQVASDPIPNGTRVRVVSGGYMNPARGIGAMGTVARFDNGVYEIWVDGDLSDTWPYTAHEIEAIIEEHVSATQEADRG